MPIAASHVIDGRGQRQVLIVGAFYGAQKGAEVGQVTEL